MSQSPRLKLPLKLVFQAFSLGVALTAASCGDDSVPAKDAQVSDAGPGSDADAEMFAGYCIEGSFPGIDGSLCPGGPVHTQADCPAGCNFYG